MSGHQSWQEVVDSKVDLRSINKKRLQKKDVTLLYFTQMIKACHLLLEHLENMGEDSELELNGSWPKLATVSLKAYSKEGLGNFVSTLLMGTLYKTYVTQTFNKLRFNTKMGTGKAQEEDQTQFE
jgi:hypothetical protein